MIISGSLSPNTETEDVWQAVKMLCMPFQWKEGDSLKAVEHWFLQKYNTDVVLFNSGRSALLAILKAFDIGAGDEVIVQAFTCVAVPNSVRWTGATSVYSDIDETYNIDPKLFEQNITKKTKAIIVQHTFGKSADMKSILLIAKKYKLFVIEDFAHTMSLPMQGDAAFFSFGRDKVLSSVWGGAATINPKHQVPSTKIKKFHKTLPLPSAYWIFQQLLHPIMFAVILPMYALGLGKALLVMLQKLRLLSFPVYPEEKKGKQPLDFSTKYPNALASLLVKQLYKLDRYTNHRKAITKIYGGNGVYLRFPMLVEDPDTLRAHLKYNGILIGNWYHNVVDPTGVDWEAIGYIRGSCPNAEEAAKHIINLPTRITVNDARRILSIISI